MKMFAVFDDAVKAYNNPFYCHTKGEAIRGFMQAVNDRNLSFHQAPQDYTLFEIGEYDNSTGFAKMYDAKQSLGTALEFIRKE